MQASIITKLQRLRMRGTRDWPRFVIHALLERYYEYRLGIESAEFVKLTDLGINNPSYVNHSPTKYQAFFRIMNSIDIDEHDVFMDYGSGMGRAVIAAATYPLRRAIGVEISEKLTRVALQNLENARAKLKCKNVEFVTMDAASYVLPDDVTIVFFYNPFRGQVLSAVVDNIRSSLIRQPRRMTIIYLNPRNYKARSSGATEADFEQHAERSTWIAKTKEFRHLSTECCVYETVQGALSV